MGLRHEPDRPCTCGFANFAFETGMVFYNAMLPGLAPESHVGWLSEAVMLVKTLQENRKYDKE